jgi:hypothetical protein
MLPKRGELYKANEDDPSKISILKFVKLPEKGGFTIFIISTS